MNTYLLQIFEDTTPVHRIFAPDNLDVPADGVIVEGVTAKQVAEHFSLGSWEIELIPNTDSAMAFPKTFKPKCINSLRVIRMAE